MLHIIAPGSQGVMGRNLVRVYREKRGYMYGEREGTGETEGDGVI